MATESARRRWSASAVLLAVFIAGAITGAGVLNARRHHCRSFGRGGHRLPPPLEKLDLTADQRRQAEVVFEKYRPQLDAESQQKVRELMDAELMPLLTETQRARFEQFKFDRQLRSGRRPLFFTAHTWEPSPVFSFERDTP